MQLPRALVGDLDDGDAEPSENVEIDARVALELGDAADDEHRAFDAALMQRARDDEAVAAVVAVAAEHGDARRRDRRRATSIAATTCRPAFSISTSDGMPIVLDGAAVGLAHLRGVEDPHVGWDAGQLAA